MRLIKDWLEQFGQRKQTRAAITREDGLQVFPLRNPDLEWSTDDEGLVVATLRRPDRLWSRVVAALLQVPDTREVRLDEVGTFVWNLCDGENSVNDLVDRMAQQYRLSRREVEVSLAEFLRLLARRGMLLVVVPEELVDKLDPQTARALGLRDTPAPAPPSDSSAPPAEGDSPDDTDPPPAAEPQEPPPS